MDEKEYEISARKLKGILGNRSDFSDWIKTHINKNNLKENIDFLINNEGISYLRKKTTKMNYFLTIEAAHKIIFNSQKGKKVKMIKERLKMGSSLNEILNQMEEEEELQMQIITIEDKQYPHQLRKIKNPPNQLYIKGNINNLNGLGFAVIGSRYCSNTGRQICRRFTKGLVEYNLNIISGLAVGIDSCAHRACLEVKGKTIAVLPSGFNNIYPKQNEELVNRIIEKGGTVISEYPPDFEKTSDSCRERNRIMSALAIGTLVIEAKERSGTSITVDYTHQQGKKAFCIPSSLLNSKGIGTNKMIKEKRAQIVTEVEDIIKEYSELKLEKRPDFELINAKKEKSKKKKTKVEIAEENLEIYNILSKEPMHISEIAKIIGKPINEILYKLTILELQGAIEELPGKNFKVKQERE